VAESNLHPEQEAKKRRTKRIIQAVPLTITGVDALGRPFQERTSTLTINCQGCRYQSKHYVLKNMWVTLEIPHSETGRSPRVVRGRVTWIQRPRTVRELFQIAVELEVSGNVWGVAFPPSDWFPFPDSASSLEAPAQPQPATLAPQPRESRPAQPPHSIELESPEDFEEDAVEEVTHNVRVIPIAASNEAPPAASTEAPAQLSQQMAHLVSEAKKEIQSAIRESANQAVMSESRVLLADLHAQVLDAAKKSAADAVAEQIEATRHQTVQPSQDEQQSSLSALREEMARELNKQVSEVRQQIDSQLAEVERVKQTDFEQRIQTQLQAATQKVENLTRTLAASENEARVTIEQLRLSSEQAATNELRLWQDQMDQRFAEAQSRLAQMDLAAKGLKEQMAAAATIGEVGWRGALDAEMDVATEKWRERTEALIEEASRKAAERFGKSAEATEGQIEKLLRERIADIGNSQSQLATEADDTVAMFRAAINQEIARGESVFSQLQQSASQLDAKRHEFTKEIEAASDNLAQRGQVIFKAQSTELARQAESVVAGMAERLRSALEVSGHKIVEELVGDLHQRITPELARVEEATKKLAFDGEEAERAMAAHQERVWQASDLNLQSTITRARELFAQIEKEFSESARESSGRWFRELESKATETTQGTFEALYKSADWYEKKIQNQMQTTLQKGVDQAAALLRDKAAELSGMFGQELDHTSRSYVEHAQGQIRESATEAAERVAQQITEGGEAAATLFQERAGEVAQQQFEAYSAMTKTAFEQNTASMEATAAQFRSKLESDARGFAVEFQRALSQHMQQTTSHGFQELNSQMDQARENLQNETQALQRQFRSSLEPLGVAALDEHKKRLDNASNAWLLTTVTKLTQRAETHIEDLAEATERKLKGVCSAVINEMGAALRQRLAGLAAPFGAPATPDSFAPTAKPPEEKK
jgi:hypothetical protein